MKNIITNFSFASLKQFLWENTSSRQTIAKNTLWLGASELSINLLKFTLLIYAARVLGDTGFGEFAFVSSFAAVFGIFFDFGLSEAITREFAKHSSDEKKISSLFSLKLMVSVVTAIVVVALSFLIGHGSLQIPLLVMSSYILFSSISGFLFGFFRARQKMQLEFVPNLVQNLAIAIVGFLLLSIVPTVLNLVTSYLVGAFIALVPTVVYFHFKISPVKFGFDKTVWKEFFHIAYPLALVGVVSAALYNNIDSLMLGFYGQLKQNGWYSAAYRVVTFSLLPMVFIYQSFFPAMSKALEDSRDRLEQLWGNQFQIFSFLGFPIFFGGILLSGPIIRFLYPAEYEPAVVTLKILIGCVLVIYLQMPFKQILVVFNEQKKVFYMFLAGMVLNIVLNIITIPYLSLNGTAISTLIAQTLVLAGLSFLTVRKTHLKILTRSTKIVCSAAFVSSVAMVCVLSLLDHNLHIFWLVGIGILVYLVLFFSLYRAGKSIIDIYEPQR